jgi:hypothetical protein
VLVKRIKLRVRSEKGSGGISVGGFP